MADTIARDALRPDHTDPVRQLLTVGETSLFSRAQWVDYPETYALRSEHIPALIRMSCDLTLHQRNQDGPEIWAPVHAWRALAQLRAVEAVGPLLEFMRIPLEDDAVSQEFPTVFGMIG